MSKYTMAGMTRHQMKSYRNLRELGADIDRAIEQATENTKGGTRRIRRLDRERLDRFRKRTDGRACRQHRRHPAHFPKPKSVLLTVRSRNWKKWKGAR